jgi:hypothetical protein
MPPGVAMTADIVKPNKLIFHKVAKKEYRYAFLAEILRALPHFLRS